MFEKHFWKSGILSKDAGRWPAFLLKISLFHMCLSNILFVKTNYLVYPEVETLVENGLTFRRKLLSEALTNCSSQNYYKQYCPSQNSKSLEICFWICLASSGYSKQHQSHTATVIRIFKDTPASRTITPMLVSLPLSHSVCEI